MAIGNVIEKNNSVIAYDEKDRQLFLRFINTKNGDCLKGYTSTTVNIKQGRQIVTYNEKGLQINSIFV